MRRWVFLLVVAASTLTAVPKAEAAALPPTAACTNCIPSARGGEGTITVRNGVSDRVPGRGSPTQGRGQPGRDYSYVNEKASPTCLGNGLHEKGNLCTFALTSCDALDQVRFWIWHQTVTVTVGKAPGEPDVTTSGPWEQEQGTYCLGPDDPGVPSIVTTLEAAQDAFESRVRDLPAPTTRTTPGPRTLVHYATAFSARNASPFSFDVTVAGATVHLHALPTRYRWHFGDGTTADTTGPTTTHSYSGRGTKGIRVDVTWGGWFTVGGSSERYPIDPPARATGAPSALSVVEARAENIG